MCHGKSLSRFPEPLPGEPFEASQLAGLHFGRTDATETVAIVPDIWGCNAFYRGLSTHLSEQGLGVFLLDPFHGLGPLPEATREAAFERRGKVRDLAYVDAFEAWLRERKIGGVIGFCLGGLYVFDLVRRGWRGDLVAFYPFPQGLPNQDPLTTPFDYLAKADVPHTVLLGDGDVVVGLDNISKLESVAAGNPAIDLHVYAGSGHGFLSDLDGDRAPLVANAEDALARCKRVILAA